VVGDAARSSQPLPSHEDHEGSFTARPSLPDESTRVAHGHRPEATHLRDHMTSPVACGGDIHDHDSNFGHRPQSSRRANESHWS